MAKAKLRGLLSYRPDKFMLKKSWQEMILKTTG